MSNGQNRVVDSLPASPGGFGCIGSCRYNWDERLLFSADGAYLSFVRNLPDAAFRIWKADGTLVKTFDTGAHPTMSVWSGSTLYFRDDKGVQAWRNGSQSLVLPGVSWIRPRASPGGGKIVYESRDSPGDLAHVNLLDTATGNAQDLATSRSGPAFLNPHLIWYRQERPCTPTDHCVEGPTIPSGKTYIYDLDDKTETESLIAAVFDVWPHTA